MVFLLSELFLALSFSAIFYGVGISFGSVVFQGFEDRKAVLLALFAAGIPWGIYLQELL